ncbi:hypothetical protein MRB53_019197 [Persea americana]|uniref:Uncharacterized protein n=1 Tax=Persea americana TaxID=3435 RepID=A0ACC2KXI5_PERAE|nr:hypothetical protein MRB53_019197 [Persea americana]
MESGLQPYRKDPVPFVAWRGARFLAPGLHAAGGHISCNQNTSVVSSCRFDQLGLCLAAPAFSFLFSL